MAAIEIVEEEAKKCVEDIKAAEQEIKTLEKKKRKKDSELELDILENTMEKYRKREEDRLIEEFRWFVL